MPDPKPNPGMLHPKFIAQQFKPGQSGCPGGPQAPGVARKFETIVAQVLGEKIPGSDMEKREALARVFVDAMLKRDGAMIKAYLDREWPATQKHEIGSLDGSTVTVTTEPERLDEVSEILSEAVH